MERGCRPPVEVGRRVTSAPDSGFASFRSPAALYVGRGSLAILTQLAPLVGERILLCTDPTIERTPAFDLVTRELRAARCSVGVFAQTEPEVPVASVERCLAVAREHQADAVVALGGGSCIDLGKLVALLLTDPRPLEDYYGEGKVLGPVAPLIAIPTTAGTGSEVTPVAVVEDPSYKFKVGIRSRHLIPSHAICDSEVTKSCPPTVTAQSGIDALAHAVEAYTASRAERTWSDAAERVFIGKNPISDILAVQSIELIGSGLERAVRDGSDIGPREQMTLGATLAGLAFGQAGTTLAHALQYPIGAATKTPHGAGIGALLPYAMRFNLPPREPEMSRIAHALGAAEQGASEEATALAAIDWVARLCRAIGLPTSIRGLGIERGQLPSLAADAVGIRTLLDNNPRPVNEDSLREILEAAWAGDLDLVP